MAGPTSAIDHLTDAQRQLLGGGSGVPRPMQTWGSQFLLPLITGIIGGVPVTPDKNFINLQFDEPCELLLEWVIEPILADPGPEIVCKAVIGNGRSSRVETWAPNNITATGGNTLTIRRVLVAQSLQVSANRIDTGNPAVTLHMWASRRVAGSAPVVIASQIVIFAAAVAVQTILKPPTEATYVQVTRGSEPSTDIEFLTTQATGLLEQVVGLVVNSSPSALYALDPRVTGYRLQRSPSVAAADIEVQWCR